jgi:hypothetical protein
MVYDTLKDTFNYPTLWENRGVNIENFYKPLNLRYDTNH